MIKVFVVDQSALVCQMLSSMLQGEDDFEVVGIAHKAHAVKSNKATRMSSRLM